MAAQIRKPSLTDLTDEPWALLPPLIPLAKRGGRPRTVDRRAVSNTILYLNRTGCQWDRLPHDLLPKSTVDEYCARWRDDGTWQPMRDALRADVRRPQAPSPAPTPSAASLDSPSVQTTARGGERGFDGGQKITGRKRHGGVETLGRRFVVVGTRAAIDDAVAAPQVLAPFETASYPRVEVVWADSTYHHHALNRWIAPDSPGTWHWEVVRRPPGATGFVLWPKRGVVERTCAWLGRCRRRRRDDERQTASSESMLRVSAIHLMLRRLKPSPGYPPFRYRVAA